ncbi:N-(5'-phosphoribosyl)anthranilate isomerase [Thiosulfatimonas sediminis]|uniref:N-(5'-phosphoribosyl)anthranilate isomerase n=1 Tax=Thiosulfatimonas sediminis TaxID=2675054 RepID=A0A6F8PW77_9GAMM|nr:phosphoribosylanthranilate isomerase [Thiosulfatimonas sediminis]BBP46381.1 N-(5'-phosphoribosyl)anthranilate isomerase [Thiosulfatimonas sediminis]
MRTRVKICGLTRVEDALVAIEAGADAIGLVFYEPSPRYVDIVTARAIAEKAPAFVTVTALFVNPDVAFVEQVLSAMRIDLLQFHGDESAAFCRQFGRNYIKAVPMKADTDVQQIASEFYDCSGLLLDTYKPGVPGGTGEAFNWQLVPQTCAKPIILAGGLTPQNAAAAIVQTAPWALDVSGGVEASKGIKSADKISQFMQEVMSTVR